MRRRLPDDERWVAGYRCASRHLRAELERVQQQIDDELAELRLEVGELRDLLAHLRRINGERESHRPLLN